MSKQREHVKLPSDAVHKKPSSPSVSRTLDTAGLHADAAVLQRALADPGHTGPRGILALQCVAGNHAVTRLIQAKLTVGAAGDRYEQEADRVAEQVSNLQISNFKSQTSNVQRQAEEEEEVQAKPLAATITPLVQRQAEEEEEVQTKPLLQRQAEEEEEVQTKPLLQRQAEEEEEEPLQGKLIEGIQRVGEEEEEEPIQGKLLALRAVQGPGAGFEASDELASRLAASRGGGSPLSNEVRAFMEPRFGADFSGVRIHMDGQAIQMNREVSAQAFTHGQDIYLGEGKTDLESGAGKKLLAHELTHVVQQARNIVSRTFLQRFHTSGSGEAGIIQREFHPVTTSSKAHLRNDGAWGAMIGSAIPADSEVVADKTDQKTQTRRIGWDTTWTRAVDMTGANWTAADKGRTTYIRNSRLGVDKHYPETKDNQTYKPPRRQAVENSRLNWHENTGEFVEIEDSLTTPNAKISQHKGAYKRITPATGQIDPLDAQEHFQIDTPDLEQHLKNRVQQVLTDATVGVAWQDKLVTDGNIKKVMYEADEGSKALRFDNFGKSSIGQDFISYYKWVTDPHGPFERIQEGAEYVQDSLEHWRKWLYPPNGDGVTITSITLTGSDLHESGLGVMFVKFNKTNAGGNVDYPEAKEHELVVKPEERVLEQKLFGPQAESLASTVNTGVGLAGPAQITTYKQQVDAGFGTLCEKVVATQAKKLPSDVVRPITQALKESLVFVLITGLTDLHGENVLWDIDGKPHMIDADNALKLKFMTPSQATAQNGYIAYSPDANTEFVRKVYASSVGYETAIMKALKTPSTPEQRLLLSKAKEIFSTSVGRTVPIKTASWGDWLMTFISIPREGTNLDISDRTTASDPKSKSKWEWCDSRATKVPTGADGTPGLKGEVGLRSGTDGNFQKDREKAQIYADFKVGQIPFYNYEYGTGNVKHNGQIIWNGQPITERMAGLFTLFPNQLDV